MVNLFRKIVIINYCQMRYLPRWAHRRPAKVILPENYDSARDASITEDKPLTLQDNENKEKLSSYPKIKWKQPSSDKSYTSFASKENFSRQKLVKPLSITQKIQSHTPQVKSIDMLEATIDEEGNFVYTKMQNNDIRVSQIMADVKSKKKKESENLILLEGKILIREALEAGCKLDYILFSRMKEVELLKPYLPKSGAKLYKMPYRELQNWSDLTTTPGIMGIFKIPDTESFSSNDVLPLTVICDNIREPSNLGAILRTCSGVGCEKVILTKGCVNVWETKVIRSACGAHFKLRISKKTDWNDIQSRIPENSHIFIADNNTVTSTNNLEESVKDLIVHVPSLPYFGVNFRSSKHIVLIIGGETEGISEDSYLLAKTFNGARLNVPLSNGVDSLNTGTALGIIAFEIKRQLTQCSTEQMVHTVSVQ